MGYIVIPRKPKEPLYDKSKLPKPVKRRANSTGPLQQGSRLGLDGGHSHSTLPSQAGAGQQADSLLRSPGSLHSSSAQTRQTGSRGRPAGVASGPGLGPGLGPGMGSGLGTTTPGTTTPGVNGRASSQSPPPGTGRRPSVASDGGRTARTRGSHVHRFTPGSTMELVQALEDVRARTNAGILHALHNEEALEYGRERLMLSIANPGVRSRQALIHSHERATGRRKVMEQVIQSELAMVSALKTLGIRSPVALAEYFEPSFGEKRPAGMPPSSYLGSPAGVGPGSGAVTAQPSVSTLGGMAGQEEDTANLPAGIGAINTMLAQSGISADLTEKKRSHKSSRGVARVLLDTAHKEKARVGIAEGAVGGGQSGGPAPVVGTNSQARTG